MIVNIAVILNGEEYRRTTMRPIDADELIKKINYSFYPYERVRIDTITGCFLTEDVAPTIDAEPVRHGHWIKEAKESMIPVEYDINGNVIIHKYIIYRCSICNGASSNHNYCPNCGARMDDYEE